MSVFLCIYFLEGLVLNAIVYLVSQLSSLQDRTPWPDCGLLTGASPWFKENITFELKEFNKWT